MKKQFKFLALAMLLASVVSYAFTKGQNFEETPDLALENVEALSGVDATTSWNCVGTGTKCYRKCGICGTVIKGKGSMTGSHNCTIF